MRSRRPQRFVALQLLPNVMRPGSETAEAHISPERERTNVISTQLHPAKPSKSHAFVNLSTDAATNNRLQRIALNAIQGCGVFSTKAFRNLLYRRAVVVANPLSLNLLSIDELACRSYHSKV